MSVTTINLLPPPLVTFRHPIRWIKNKAVLLLDAAVLAHIGMLIMVGLYFLLTQENATAKHWWDTTVSNSDLRHSIRDVGEGILGGFLAQGIVWNHFKKKHQKAGRIFDTLHDKFKVPTIPAALLATVLFGAAGFTAIYYVLHAFHVHAGAVGVNGSFLHRQTIWSASWDKKVMGYGAAFFARRPMRVIFDRTQLWFAERRVALGKKVRCWTELERKLDFEVEGEHAELQPKLEIPPFACPNCGCHLLIDRFQKDEVFIIPDYHDGPYNKPPRPTAVRIVRRATQ